jgi:hypothetical protein
MDQLDHNNTAATMTTKKPINMTICLDLAKLVVVNTDEDLTEEQFTADDIDAMFVLFTNTNCSTTKIAA